MDDFLFAAEERRLLAGIAQRLLPDAAQIEKDCRHELQARGLQRDLPLSERRLVELALGFSLDLLAGLGENDLEAFRQRLEAEAAELLAQGPGFHPVASLLLVVHQVVARHIAQAWAGQPELGSMVTAAAKASEYAQMLLAEAALARCEEILNAERIGYYQARTHSQTLRRLNRGLNRAGDAEEQLKILAEPGMEAGASLAYLVYLDPNDREEAEWAEVAAAWHRNGGQGVPSGTRFQLSRLPSAHLLVANPDDLLAIDDVANDGRLDDTTRELLLDHGTRALVLIPLSRPERWIGLIVLGWAEPHSFDLPEVEIYRALITRASSAVENRRLLAQTQKALASVQQSERLLRSVIDTTPDWIFIKDQQHRFQLVNRSYAEAFHRVPEDFVGHDNLEMGWPEELVKGNPEKGLRGIWADDREVLDSGKTKSIPHDLVAVDGNLRVFDTIKIPLHDVEGKVWGLLGFARDMTELKRAEEELETYKDLLEELVEDRTAQLVAVNEQLHQEIAERRRAEARITQNERFLQAVFDGIQDGISVLDQDLRIVRVNRAMERWYSHMTPLAGRKCFLAYHLRSEPCVTCPTARAVEKGVPQMDEIPLVGPGGMEGWLELYAFPMFDDIGRPAGVIEYVRDISERKRMEQYVLRTERLAAMGRLAAALAHEINNPLHAIENSLELVLDFPLAEPRRQEYLHAVRREIERLMALTNRILDFARPPKVEQRPTHVADVVQHALTLADKQLHQSSIEVGVDIPDNLPPVYAARDHLAQVFLNLIINAIEEMPGGGALLISAWRAQDRVEVVFADSGPGIAPKALPMIFEPFFTTKEDGTGLGLAISHNIIEQYGGTISAGNAPGGGAVFTVGLPVRSTAG